MNIYFEEKTLLTPPTERAAFSDRQAYVCAELSKLAYFKFEGGHTLDEALSIAKNIFGDDKRLNLLEENLKLLLTSSPSSEVESKNALNEILTQAGFSLVETYSIKGSQAFICTRDIPQNSGNNKTVAYLVFRGTEPKDFKDIKTDINATLIRKNINGSEIDLHSGYYEAFEIVKDSIQSSLKETAHDQLIITGHSLGGALAILATRILAHSINGACYTFGAPPVGSVEFQNGLKTPVYEIINEIDIVPRLPNPIMTKIIKSIFWVVRLIAKIFTVLERILASGTWDEKLEKFINSMTKYRHPGYLSYLVGSGNNSILRYNVDITDRMKWWIKMLLKLQISGFNKMISDHSIDNYCEKLKVHALNRQD